MSGGRPKVIGIENRFCQFEADHHSAGETAGSTPSLAKLLEPGGEAAALRQAWSAATSAATTAGRSEMPVDRDHHDRAGDLVVAAERLVLDVAAHLELHRRRCRRRR